jgi:hypothetical protein
MLRSAIGRRGTSFPFSLFTLILVFGLAIVPILCATPAHSAQVTVAWDQEGAPVVGYKVYYGASSGKYTSNADAGNTTSYTLSNLSNSTYYLAATAYDSSGNESAYSKELVINSMTATAGTGGSISPSGSFFLTRGESQTFTITPNANYKISGVTVDGTSVGAVSSYSFSNVTANHTITASFTSTSGTGYTITATAQANGSISPSGSVSVSSGGSKTFTITPNSNYKISGVTVDGASVGAVSTYTFSNVTANHTISASFTSSATTSSYTITASAQANGSISPSGSVSVSSGGSKTFTITPSTNYKISGVTVDGASVGAVSTYTFSSVKANHTISASFASSATTTKYTITASAQANGAISPSGSVSISSGGSKTFTITPNANYRVQDVQVDGSSVGALAAYTFSNVTKNHTISATFYSPPIADAGPNQIVAQGKRVALNGSNSRAGTGSIASYTWTQTGGTRVALSNASAANPTFTAPYVDGAISLKLTVKDGSGLQSTDTCVVNVITNETPPVANAGLDQTVSEYSIVTLDGSKSTDSGGYISSYLWEQVGGIPVAISSPESYQPIIVAPEVGSGSTSLVFRLTATDSTGLKSTDTCIVNVSAGNDTPKAVAGASQAVRTGSSVTLNGSSSTDGDDGIASYRWRQTTGAPVTLSDATAQKPTFTAPTVASNNNVLTFRLTVTDKGGLASEASQTITVTSNSSSTTTTTLTFAPTADAYVRQASPNANYGTKTNLMVQSDPIPYKSYLQFAVSGVTGTVQSAKLRIYAYNGTSGPPAVYATGNSWTEKGITWANAPASSGSPLSKPASIATNSWVEYDVTAAVTGNGTYSFVLPPTSTDFLGLYSRESSQSPQLVFTIASP